MDDVELCHKARLGDRAAWRTIIRRHTPMVHRLAARMLGPGAEAEDACQEVFMRAHRSFATYDATRPLGPWLGRIAYVTSLKRLARAARVETPSDALDVTRTSDLDADVGDPERSALGREAGDIVRAALARLSAQDRALVTMRYVDGLSDVEVGEVVGMNRNTVRTRLHRARLVLKRALTPILGGSGDGGRS